MKLQTLARKTIIVLITLLIVVTPVMAADANDLTQYTVQTGGGTVNPASSSEIRFENHPADTLAAVYENEINTYEKDITISYNMNFTQCSGAANHIKTGLMNKELGVPNDPSEYYNVTGLDVTCGSMNLDNSFSEDSNTAPNFVQGEIRHVNLEYDYSEALFTATVYETTAANNIYYQESVPYAAAQNFTVVAAITRGNGTSSSEVDARITDYSVTITDTTNFGEDLDTYHIKREPLEPFDKIHTLNVSSNWISLHGFDAQAPDQYVRKNLSTDGDDQVTIKYEMIINRKSTEGATNNIGVGHNVSSSEITEPKIVGSLYGRRAAGDQLRLDAQGTYFGSDVVTDIGQVDTRYWGKTVIFYHNATVRSYLYNDSARTDQLSSVKHEFPAGDRYRTFYAALSEDRTNRRMYGLIGNIEVDIEDVENTNGDLTTYTKSGVDSQRINETENWLTVRNLDRDEQAVLYNTSGPGVGPSQLQFRYYVDSSSATSSYIHFGWANQVQNDAASLDKFSGMWFVNRRPDLVVDGDMDSFDNNVVLNYNNMYWGTLTKNDTHVKYEIFNDSERTILVDEEAKAYDNTVNYNHTYAVASRGEFSGGEEITALIGIGTNPEFVEPADFDAGNITLEVPVYMKHGTSTSYVVRVTSSGEDVTDAAVVTSGNTTVITISGDQLVATSDRSIAQVVTINATYNGFGDSKNVTVANRTIDNIGIMPSTNWVSTVLSIDSEQATYGIGSLIQWLFLIIFISAAAGNVSRNPWIAIGVMLFLEVLVWVLGFISIGFVLTSFFMAAFFALILVGIPRSEGQTTNVRVDTGPDFGPDE